MQRFLIISTGLNLLIFLTDAYWFRNPLSMVLKTFCLEQED